VIRAIVVDDEPVARSSIRTLLNRDPEIEVVAECGSGAEALAAIRAQKPEIAFLDIEMPECDGFDVLELLGNDAPPAIVFVTAYDTYAIRAFEAEALDYLLKPFDDDRFARTLERAKRRVATLRAHPHAPKTLVFKSAGNIVFLPLAEVDWIESADYYSRVYGGTKTHLLRRSMADLERDLDPAVFRRIHRSAIVRLDRVSRLETSEAGEYEVVLVDGTRLPLSRRHRKALLDGIGEPVRSH
jgi:two-component system LytT family response regulator